ncbi:MAG: hypothetical protein WD227_10940 [Vicinamibacterales bacterium]
MASIAASYGAAMYVLVPVNEISLIGSHVRTDQALQGRLRELWADALSARTVAGLSPDETEILRMFVHSPLATLATLNRAFGLLFLLTQRLTEVREGVHAAAKLGPVPLRSLLDSDAALERIAVKMKFSAEDVRHRVLAVFVSRDIRRWARKYSLATPDLESVAALIRAQWTVYPDEPLPIHPEPAETIRRLLAGAFRPTRFKNRRNRAFAPVLPTRSLAKHADWLVRLQVLNETTTQIARDEGCHRQAVDDAIRRLAARLGLVMAARKRPGRPKGRRETSLRRVVVN